MTAEKAMNNQTSELYTASQWKLMLWKFRKHRLAVYSAYFVGILYLIGGF